jgi:hypothetical protein
MLPNVEPTTFCIRDKQLYYVDEGVFYRVTKLMIIANGTRDLCVALDSNGFIAVKKVADIAIDKILFIPKTDLLWVEFEKSVRGTQWSAILEFDSDVKRMLDRLCILGLRHTDVRGSKFDMYAGRIIYGE